MTYILENMEVQEIRRWKKKMSLSYVSENASNMKKSLKKYFEKV